MSVVVRRSRTADVDVGPRGSAAYPLRVRSSRPWSSRRLLVVGLGLALPASVLAQGEPSTESVARDEALTLGTIEISTRDIYAAEDAEDSVLARLLNATHATTREGTIRNELWIRPGEPIRQVDAEELERNLRATGLFAEVRVTLRPTARPGVVDLVIVTEDRLSFSFGASGSFVGAVSSFGLSASESNLFGTGDRFSFGFSENSEDEFRGAFLYRDRHFLGSWVTATAQVGRTEEGEFGALGFERPFKHLADVDSWRINVSSTENAIDYYDAGETIAEVPQKRDTLEAAVFRRFGPVDRSWTVGLRGQHDNTSIGDAEGPAASTIDVPGDTDTTFGGLSLGYRYLLGFKKVQGLDTLEYVQDLTLSTGFEVLGGGTLRAEVGEDDAVQPTFGLGTFLSAEVLADTYVSVRADSRVRLEDDDPQGWFTSLDASAFELALRPHTLAAHLAFDEAYEGEALPVQLTLGEDGGLRGYPAREFEGGRTVRMNLEDRIDLGARVGSFEFGAVVFFDVGWIEDRGQGFGQPLRSTGFGLRVGSQKLLGSRVVRIDLSFPLDEVDGEQYDPLVSLTLGQVFGFR